MAAQRPKAPTKPTRPAQPQAGGAAGGGESPTGGNRRPPAQLTRAQIKAMEARAAATARATAIARGEDADTVTQVTRTSTQTYTPRSRTREGLTTNDLHARARGVSAATAAEFSIKTEMEYQRRDLMRLLLLAGVILVVFIVLHFVLR